MTRGPDLATARRDEEDARWRFLQTARALERRLHPGPLFEDAAAGAGTHAADVARQAAEAARARPRTMALVSGIAIAFVARRHLLGLFRHARKDPGAAERAPEGPTSDDRGIDRD